MRLLVAPPLASSSASELDDDLRTTRATQRCQRNTRTSFNETERMLDGEGLGVPYPSAELELSAARSAGLLNPEDEALLSSVHRLGDDEGLLSMEPLLPWSAIAAGLRTAGGKPQRGPRQKWWHAVRAVPPAEPSQQRGSSTRAPCGGRCGHSASDRAQRVSISEWFRLHTVAQRWMDMRLAAGGELAPASGRSEAVASGAVWRTSSAPSS